MSLARFTRSLLLSALLLVGFSGQSSFAADYDVILGEINLALSDIRSQLYVDVAPDVESIATSASTTASMAPDVYQILTTLINISQRQNNNLPYLNRLPDILDSNEQQVRLLKSLSNVLSHASSGGKDVLAGNPWWGTNSAFALTTVGYNQVYPKTPLNGLYSFPQLASMWSSMLTYPQDGSFAPASSVSWVNMFGTARLQHGGWYGYFNPYTWFDWMSDATRSNWVAQATALDVAKDILANTFALSNLVETSQDKYRANQMNSSVSSAESEGRAALEEAYDSSSEQADTATSVEPTWSPTGSYTNPYDPIGELIQTYHDDIVSSDSGVVPDLEDVGKGLDEKVVIFDGNSGIDELDQVGEISFNIREEMGEYRNTVGNVMENLWNVINAALTVVLVVRSLHEIGEAI